MSDEKSKKAMNDINLFKKRRTTQQNKSSIPNDEDDGDEQVRVKF
jgi:hypothetical protein